MVGLVVKTHGKNGRMEGEGITGSFYSRHKGILTSNYRLAVALENL